MKQNSVLKIMAVLLVTAFSVTLTSCGVKDSDIQKNASEKLAGIPGVTAEVKNGVVTLSGECKDEAGKAMAETDVKTVKGVKSVVNNCTVAVLPPPPPPVAINTDDALTTGVRDAVKDFEGVTAEVKDGEVTLTGTIRRSSLPNLMQAINTLKPKKINNQITIK